MKKIIKIMNIFLYIFSYRIEKVGVIDNPELYSWAKVGDYGLSIGFDCTDIQYKYKLIKR